MYDGDTISVNITNELGVKAQSEKIVMKIDRNEVEAEFADGVLTYLCPDPDLGGVETAAVASAATGGGETRLCHRGRSPSASASPPSGSPRPSFREPELDPCREERLQSRCLN